MILEMTDICKDYDQGKNITQVLRNVNLSVEEGEYLAIMGPSGSGKTTLMNLIGCLDTPTSGSYIFEGRDITKCSSKELSDIRNKKIGFVFQSFNLLPKMSALDNTALPLLYGGVRKKERRERAFEALRLVGLEDKVESRPDQLSGGQCQRVAIARAIISNPAILLADEPTGALDSASGAAVMELFESLHEAGSTIIMITHDSNVAARAKTIKYIYDGVLTDAPPFQAEQPRRKIQFRRNTENETEQSASCLSEHNEGSSDGSEWTAACHPEQSEGSSDGGEWTADCHPEQSEGSFHGGELNE